MPVSPVTEAIQAPARKPGEPLSLVFYDVNDPLDKTYWAGTAAHIIHSFERAGYHVRTVGNHVPRLRRLFLAIWFRYYRWVEKKSYHPDRDLFWTWVYSKIGSRKLARLGNVDAVVTVSSAFTAYLETDHPTFLLHDSTWGRLSKPIPTLAVRTSRSASSRAVSPWTSSPSTSPASR